MNRMSPCLTYWGSHGCDLERGHKGAHECDCCDCLRHPDPDSGCVATAPYYGWKTGFYGEDAPFWRGKFLRQYPEAVRWLKAWFR